MAPRCSRHIPSLPPPETGVPAAERAGWSMAPLRFGLIGTGYWALHNQGTALSASPDASLRGVWGRDPGKAQDLAARLGTTAFDDVDRLFAEVDAVALAVPPDVQAQLAVRAAAAGCHLLLEKPLALDVEGAKRVVAAADDAGVAALVFFTSRFRPEVETWTQEAAADGPWHSAHLVQYANIFQPGSPYASSAWRRQYGAMWDIGPHALSAVLPMMGPVMSVSARRGPSGSDTVHLVLGHAAGTPAPGGAAGGPSLPAGPGPAGTSLVSLSLTAPPAAATSQLTLYGESGARVRPEGRFEASDAFRNAVSELSRMVSTGRRHHACDAHFGLEVVRVLSAAERAIDLPGVELV